MDTNQHTQQEQTGHVAPSLAQENVQKGESPQGEIRPAAQKLRGGMTSDRVIEVLLAFIITVFTGALWWTSTEQVSVMRAQTESMQGQLAEMKRGSEDTKDLVESAKIQAENMKSLSEATRKLAESAKIQAENTKALADAALEQVNQLSAGVKETHALGVATQDSITLAREQFNKGMRPSIRVIRTERAKFKVGEKAAMNIFYANSGKLAAVGLRAYGKLIIGPTASEIALGKETAISGEMFKRKAQLADEGETITAGEPPHFFTALSDSVLSADDMEYIEHKDFGLALLVLIEYFDDAGIYYSTESCRFSYQSKAIGFCKYHNK